jgi:hypothetical protein
VHIPGRKAGPLKGRGHFDLTIHTLFSKDSHLGRYTRDQRWSGELLLACNECLWQNDRYRGLGCINSINGLTRQRGLISALGKTSADL